MFPHCNITMEKPFSGHFLLSPSLKLDPSFFPSTFPDGFNDIVLGETDRYSTTPSTVSPQVTCDVAASSKKIGTTTRKRSLRKDRHSKIRTAQGLRDRRMRLSLDVAPEFFDIQDMLGFDKASKTLRWLITAAKPAIQELVAASRGSSKSIGISSASDSDNKGKLSASASCHPPESDVPPKAKRACRRPPPPSRRTAFPATIARESRIKARERARERTEKKSLILQSSSSFDHLLCNAAAPLEAVGEDSGSLGCQTLVAEVEERCSNSPNPVAIFDYNQSSMCPNLFHEQWYMEDIQLQTRLWEA